MPFCDDLVVLSANHHLKENSSEDHNFESFFRAKSHPQLGEDILTFIVLKDGEALTAEELYNFTIDKLADYRRPRDIRFVESLPLNPTGKMDKKQIRAKYLDT